MNLELALLSARLESLETDNKSLRAAFMSERAQNQRERGRLRLQAGLAFLAFLAAVFLSPANRSALAQGYGVTLATLNTRLTAVEAKTQYQSVDPTAKSITFSGCNLIVNDGGGSTDTIVRNAAGQGLGNLIVGYNESVYLPGMSDVRTGSHNLILGDANNYSSYGGMVVGYGNAISAAYATVSGGVDNTATGDVSSVSGGVDNTATGDVSSISGGYGNVASGTLSSVSGGVDNTATGNFSSVSGGSNITQSNDYGWAAGAYHSP